LINDFKRVPDVLLKLDTALPSTQPPPQVFPRFVFSQLGAIYLR